VVFEKLLWIKGGFRGEAKAATAPLILFVFVHLYFIDFPHASIRVFAETVPAPSF
jgi:hypothetical protein